MKYAVVLSGGSGTRLHSAVPKQYVSVGKPIIMYTIAALEKSDYVDKIVIVCADCYRAKIYEWLEESHISKFAFFAEAGSSRQLSVKSGIDAIKENTSDCDIVIFHDAVRPFVNEAILSDGIAKLADYDAALPVIPIKDTPYLSDGRELVSMVDRSRLFAGQTPEFFRFEPYYRAIYSLSPEELDAATGCCVVAMKAGLRVAVSHGEEENFKITTPSDLEKFIAVVGTRGLVAEP